MNGPGTAVVFGTLTAVVDTSTVLVDNSVAVDWLEHTEMFDDTSLVMISASTAIRCAHTDAV